MISFLVGLNLGIACWCGADWLKERDWPSAVGFWINLFAVIFNGTLWALS